MHRTNKLPPTYPGIVQTPYTHRNASPQSTSMFLIRMHLLNPRVAFVDDSVQRSSHRQSSSNNGADADEEAGEALCALFAIDDLHGRDILRAVSLPCFKCGSGKESAYIREEDARNPASRVQALLVPLILRVAASQIPLMAGHGILMRLNAALFIGQAIPAQLNQLVRDIQYTARPLPSKRQVRRRHDLDEVHEVERLLVGMLLRVVQRVEVVVRPRYASLPYTLDHRVWQLGSEAQVVDLVAEGVFDALRVEVVVQVVHVHVAVAEALARREVEVAHHLVDADAALDAAAFAALLVEVLAVVFALALLDVLASAKRPAHAGVGVSHFVAGVAAAGLARRTGSRRAIAFPAVIWIQVLACIFIVQLAILGLDLSATFALRPQSHFLDPRDQPTLHFSAHVHDVEGEQLARDAREGDVHVDLHLLAAAFVYEQFGLHTDAAVVAPFAPCEEEDEEECADRDEAAGRGADARLVYRLREGIQAGESAFRRHWSGLQPNGWLRRVCPRYRI